MSNTKTKLLTTTQHQVPDELQYLGEEARKSRSMEEFTKALAIRRTTMQVRQVKRGIGFADELIGGISQAAFSSEETRRQLEEFVTKSGYSSLRDFCNQAKRTA
jgi:hypothetical protein